jgi:hypothetical protein
MPLKQRILFCRFGFIALCVIPTLAVGALIATRPRSELPSQSRDEWQAALTDQLGMPVEIGQVSYPEPEICRFEQVVFRDPESLAIVAEAHAVELGASADCWLVGAEQLRIDATELLSIRNLLDDRVLRVPAANGKQAAKPIRFFPSDVTLQFRGRQQTFLRVEGHLESDREHVQLRLAWQTPADASQSQPGVVTVKKLRNSAAALRTWDIATGAGELPCALGSDLYPGLARLGNDCHFAGSLQIRESATGMAGILTGTFRQVDLDSLVTEHFPHQLSGRATIDVEQAEIDKGRLAELCGKFRVTKGSLNPSLLAAAEEHLGLEQTHDHHAASAPVPFDELAFSFRLDGNKLQLAGLADSTDESVLARDVAGPLVIVPPNHSTPVVNLLRTLLPDNQYQVPATRQTGALVGLLPVPDLAPARTASLPKHTPTRLRTSGPPDAAPVLRQPMLR